MRRRNPTRLLVLLLAAMTACTGCAIGTKVSTTQVTVQVRSDRLLHIAAVPRELPDGQSASKQREALFEAVARKAGGYTCVEKALGGWLPPQKDEVMHEVNDLLLVEGPPEIAYFLRKKLHEDFRQEYPFVISLPVQSVAVISAPEPTGQEAREPEAGQAAR